MAAVGAGGGSRSTGVVASLSIATSSLLTCGASSVESNSVSDNGSCTARNGCEMTGNGGAGIGAANNGALTASLGGNGGTSGTATGGAPRLALSARDFTYGRLLGLGSYSKVVLARRKPSRAACSNDAVYNEGEGCPPGTECALKIMDKRHIVKEKKVAYVKMERMILDRLRHPGIVRLLFTFQDEHSLYMGLECCHGGELFDQIRLKGKLSEDEARFYAAEVVSALEYMHSQGVVHRDLKPENILLTASGHVRISDFGCAKLLSSCQSAGSTSAVDAAAAAIDYDERSGSFVGTAEYVPPELLDNGPVSFEADLWALGCVVYQMLAGVPPFKGASEYLCFQKILSRDLCVPNHFSNEARSLVNCLLEMEPKRRLGSRHVGGYARLKSHPFFCGIPWEETNLDKLGVSQEHSLSTLNSAVKTGELAHPLFSSLAPVMAVPVRLAGNQGLRGHGLSDGDGFGSGVQEDGEGGDDEEEEEDEWAVLHLGGSFAGIKLKSGQRAL
ncbi:hypothetical protein CLOM_g18241 [Closterium sp. NIES-68]|nr:hypothetical protein CLOM_g18241 [Closterium sp. NIES-68]GJP63391.1 hypothetical protein CLOP_g20478 [Closterium sp. NIES-67]